MTISDLPNLLYITIQGLGGKAKMLNIFKEFWRLYENNLKSSGDLFYTWNYDIRLLAIELRKVNKMKPALSINKGIWGNHITFL